MYQSRSNASSWYVAGRGGSGLDDWSYPNFQVLSRPPPACRWLAHHRNHWFFTKKKEGEECSQERKERWRDRGAERGMKAGSVVALSCLWARSAPWLPSRLAHPPLSLCPLPLISLSFLGKALAEKIFMNSWACRRCWGCLKTCQFNSCVYGLGPG